MIIFSESLKKCKMAKRNTKHSLNVTDKFTCVIGPLSWLGSELSRLGSKRNNIFVWGNEIKISFSTSEDTGDKELKKLLWKKYCHNRPNGGLSTELSSFPSFESNEARETLDYRLLQSTLSHILFNYVMLPYSLSDQLVWFCKSFWPLG